MEDIEDMIGDFGGAPLGLHLPKTDSTSGSGRRNGTNAVTIKPRRRISAHSGGVRDAASNSLTCVDTAGETTSAPDKVPGTEVSAALRFCEIRSCFQIRKRNCCDSFARIIFLELLICTDLSCAGRCSKFDLAHARELR